MVKTKDANELLLECFKHLMDANDRDELGDKDSELLADVEQYLREHGYKTF